MQIKTEVSGLEVEVTEDGKVTFWDYGARLSWGAKLDPYDAKRVISRIEKVLFKHKERCSECGTVLVHKVGYDPETEGTFDGVECPEGCDLR